MGFFQATTSNNSGRCLGKNQSRQQCPRQHVCSSRGTIWGSLPGMCEGEGNQNKVCLLWGTKTIVFTVTQCSPEYNELLGLR